MNIFSQLAEKAELGGTGMALHYGFLYSCVVGMESKSVFEFGSGFSTHVILNALRKTGGKLTSVDIIDSKNNVNITNFCRNNPNWNFWHGNSNDLLANDFDLGQYDLILHDGSHVGEEVLIDLNNIYPHLKHDGIIITHDTRHPSLGNDMLKAVEEFAAGKDVEYVTIPYGFGLTVMRNKGNLTNKVELSWKKRVARKSGLSKLRQKLRLHN